MGVETCPPVNPDDEWTEFVKSQLTGRGTPNFSSDKEEKETTGKKHVFKVPPKNLFNLLENIDFKLSFHLKNLLRKLSQIKFF